MNLFPVRCDYALRALSEIALWESSGHAEPLAIEEIARKQAIPRKFLEQILVSLKRSGLVQSRRGQAGGYRLARGPEAIHFSDVLESLESEGGGALARRGGDSPTQAAKAIWQEFDAVERELKGALGKRTLASVLEQVRAR
ncbi:MAG: Rrf2 family transcriptional regulator, partial [Bdellovibrionota bacterium]